MNYKRYKDDNTAHIIGTVAAIAGILGIAYLGYKKRDCVNWNSVKDFSSRTREAFDPVVDGAKETSHRISGLARSAKSDVADSFDAVYSNLNANLDKLTGKARERYQDDIDDLRASYERLKRGRY